MEATAKIQKWGNSQGVRIPKHILDLLKWHDNEPVEISTHNGHIVIKRLKPAQRKNIKELFADFNGEYKPEPVDWGKPEGHEIW